MNMYAKELLEQLKKEKILSKENLVYLIDHREEVREEAAKTARTFGDRYYGKSIYPRGLVEFTNFCKNNCYYCGIRAGNRNVKRYRLSKEEILQACENGYEIGYRSFVLQGGEDPYFHIDRMEDIVATIHERYPECAITLSIGELNREQYQRLFDAGANRYLLRHETADEKHYRMLHPDSMSLAYRKQCLYDLKEIGYAVGTGFMVGSPFQTTEHIAKDLLFIKKLDPQMVGIGPFVPHHDTRFKDEPAGFSGAILFRDTFYKFLIPAADLKESTDIFKFAPYNKNQPSDSESATMGLGAYPGYVVLGDGSAITVLKNNGRLNVLVDINGLKRPNRVGYDVFLFVVDTKKDILTSWSTDAATYCSKTSTNAYNGRACTYYAMIDRNPDDDSKGYWDTLDF